ncbi:MAG: rhomboid family intramembrane serine protease [Propionibacteriaceae bacterium]|nr:rhomboid family intramembrane serine protease [Propionibacteriaceae bacterium]
MSWFHIGKLQVTTTVLVALIAGIGSLVALFVAPMVYFGAMLSDGVMAGEVWRLVTWPFVEPFGIWTVLSIFFFWYFGNFIEDQLGKVRMARFLVGLWAMVTAAYFVADLLLPGSAPLAGIGLIQLLLILLFIADAPNRPFFFGIPAWVLGAILLGLQLLPMVAAGNLGALAGLVLSLFGAAFWARRFGLLADITWLPGAPQRRRRKPAHLRVVQEKAVTKPTREERKARNAESRLDELLDKINASGMDSLSRSELAELKKLSKNRKRS